MNDNKNNNFFKNLKHDLPASFVVFLVALPLCLGIALASGAPLYSGLISGIIGGIVVGSLSGSALGVSGPAAGLAVIVLNGITSLGGFEIFLVAIIIAGIIQLVIGFLNAGIVAYYFPSSVIHGMLAGIGILIFLKQIPHTIGDDNDPEGDFNFFQIDGENTFTELMRMLDFISPGVLIITLISLFILVLWENKRIKANKFLTLIPAPLLVVLLGILLNVLFSGIPSLGIDVEHLVSIPISNNLSEFFGNFTLPDFSSFSNPEVYTTGIIIAVIGSLETLLCVEASDKQDPQKRITPTNRELRAQGIGNIISGLIGGLPITQVIVRSSANQQSGAKTKTSAIIHGVLLFGSVLAIPRVLNFIPLASLAAILLVIGYKLSKPSLYIKMYSQGKGQFAPFIVTIIGIVFTDLLFGIGMGMFVAVSVILYNNYKIPFKLKRVSLEGKENIKIILSEDVTFLNKASIQRSLREIPKDTNVIIDASNTHFIHYDIIEIIEDFEVYAKTKNINVSTIDLFKGKKIEPMLHFTFENTK